MTVLHFQLQDQSGGNGLDTVLPSDDFALKVYKYITIYSLFVDIMESFSVCLAKLLSAYELWVQWNAWIIVGSKLRIFAVEIKVMFDRLSCICPIQ